MEDDRAEFYVKLTVDLYIKLGKIAHSRHMSVTELASHVLTAAVRQLPVTVSKRSEHQPVVEHGESVGDQNILDVVEFLAKLRPADFLDFIQMAKADREFRSPFDDVDKG